MWMLVSTYNFSGTLDCLAFLDQTIRSKEHNTDLAGFQVHAHSFDAGCELDEFFGLDIGHTMDTGNTITAVLSALFYGAKMARRHLLSLEWSLREGIHRRPCKTCIIVVRCDGVLMVNVPDTQNPAGFCQSCLFLHASDARLENRGDLGG
jgi:hypothetical protein